MRGPSSGRAASASRVEEHHRRGLVRRAALERVQPRDRVGVLRVARQPVDRVGGEHGHAAGARSHRSKSRSPPPDAPPARCPARSRDDLGRGKPAARSSSATASRLPPPTSNATNARRPRAAGDQAPVARRARRAPPNSATRRLVADDLGRELGARARRTAGWRRPRRRPGDAGEQVAVHELDVEAEPRRVRARDVERVRADVGRRRRAGPAARRLSASAIAPEPVPTSTTRAPVRQRQRRLDHVLGLRPRDQHAPVDRQLDAAEALACRGCTRPARARAAPAHGVHERARRGPARASRPGSAISAARSTPSASREQHLGVQPRRVARRRRSARSAPSRARRGRWSPRAAATQADGLLLEPPALLGVLQRGGELVQLARRAPRRGCGR